MLNGPKNMNPKLASKSNYEADKSSRPLIRPCRVSLGVFLGVYEGGKRSILCVRDFSTYNL